jgi:hypothetical protein
VRLDEFRERVYPARIGALTLVPPKTISRWSLVGEAVVDRDAGRRVATAETSATVRREQPASLCQAGFVM